MATAALNRRVTKKSISRKDDFEKYLKKQTVQTTVNGREIAEFSWYKKVLGLI
jgi:hypothetical protein